MDVTEFALARLDDLVADTWARGGCEGQAEYVSCEKISERLPAIVAAQRIILGEHQPTEEVSHYDKDGAKVMRTVCAMCVYTGDDNDGMGNRFRVREHASWPCATVLAVASPWKDHTDYQHEWVE